jgi:hypothetical protein
VMNLAAAALAVVAALLVILWDCRVGRSQQPRHDAGQPKDRNNPPDYPNDVLRPELINRHGWTAEERNHHKRERVYWCIGTMVSVVTMAGAIIAAIIASHALTASWKAVESARDAANQASRQADASDRASFNEVRPIIWLTNEPKPPWYYSTTQGTLGSVAWHVFYTNYGKGPAVNVKVHWCLDVRVKDANSYASNCKSQFALPPLPPGKIDFFTSISAADYTPEQFASIAKTDNAVRFTGVLVYTDAYGHSYETDICTTYLAAGATVLRWK